MTSSPPSWGSREPLAHPTVQPVRGCAFESTQLDCCASYEHVGHHCCAGTPRLACWVVVWAAIGGLTHSEGPGLPFAVSAFRWSGCPSTGGRECLIPDGTADLATFASSGQEQSWIVAQMPAYARPSKGKGWAALVLPMVHNYCEVAGKITHALGGRVVSS